MVPMPPLNSMQAGLVHGLQKYNVRFLVIGGQAVNACGVTRDTQDLDILLDPSERSRQGLAALFMHHGGLPKGGGSWLEIVSVPNRLFAYPDVTSKVADLLTSIDGIEFESCMARSIAVPFGDQELQVACKDDLIAMKTVSASSTTNAQAMTIDLADIDALKALA